MLTPGSIVRITKKVDQRGVVYPAGTCGHLLQVGVDAFGEHYFDLAIVQVAEGLEVTVAVSDLAQF